MVTSSEFDVDFALFSGKKVEKIVVLKFKDDLLLRVTDLNTKETLFNYLDIVEKDEEVGALLIFGSGGRTGSREYRRFYRRIADGELTVKDLERLYNAANQFVLKLLNFSKFIVFADSGEVIPIFMAFSLACDYRIVGDDTVFCNPNLELGLIPKGGGAFFLSKTAGRARTYDILLSEQGVTAGKALDYGVVDRVVPVSLLGEEAVSTAVRFASKPSGMLSGLKALLSFCMKDLEDFLRYENELLRFAVRSPEFMEKIMKDRGSRETPSPGRGCSRPRGPEQT